MKFLSLAIDNTPIPVPKGISHLTGGLFPNGANIISLFVNLLILISILLSFVYLIWGGFEWMFSTGDKQRIESARHRIIFAIIGLLVVFIAIFIVRLFGYFFGVTLIPSSGTGVPGVM